MKYFVKTPWWLKKIYSSYIWDIKTNEKILYLTFDDGPHPQITSFVLDELKKNHAKATFFCVGNNVKLYPDTYKRILEDGHKTGNHSCNHLNGWKTKNDIYLNDIAEAAHYIESDLFRPPYGRIKRFQSKHLAEAMKVKIPAVIMWDVLSGDFDPDISSEQCLKNVKSTAKEGSIIVFHDSERAFSRMKEAFIGTLKYFSEKGYRFDVLPDILDNKPSTHSR